MAGISLINTLLGEALLVVLIAVVLLIMFKLGKLILKFMFGIIANSILGVIAILVLNSFFDMGIPLNATTLVPSALFGLPAVATLVILRFFGVSL
jgi:hypothetical protein